MRMSRDHAIALRARVFQVLCVPTASKEEPGLEVGRSTSSVATVDSEPEDN